MSSQFASGKYAIAECDRCGQRFKLNELRKLIIKTKQVSIKVCRSCYEPDHPQLLLGMYPVNDPQALREPRPDNSYIVSGDDRSGSRIIQWGWNPVGGGSGLTPNNLNLAIQIGIVTVVTT